MIVHFIFTGIISFLELTGGPHIALAQDARSPGHGQDSHIVTLVVEREAVRKATNLQVVAWDGKYVAFELGDWKIVPQGLQGTSFTKAPDYSQWVLDLSDYQNPPLPIKAHRSKLKGAFMRLTHGTLRPTYVDPLHVWSFRDSGLPAAGLADEVCLTTEISGSELTLIFKNQVSEVARLTLDDGGAGSIELRIQNTPRIDAIPQAPPTPPEEEDHHVGLYYSMLRIPPTRMPVLVASERPQDAPEFKPHHVHRLEGTKIVDDLAGTSNPMNFSTRVNCPPGDWDGEDYP